MVCRLGFLLISLACSAALAAAGWADRNEYDLVLKIRAEASAPKRLALLEQWKAGYPKSDLRVFRNELFLAAYQSSGDDPKALAAALEILADQPDNLVGLYWCALLAPESADPSPELLNAGEKAAKTLLTAKVGDPAWQKQKPQVELMAHRTLGWVLWQRKDFAAAERELATCLEQNPKDTRVSAWLGAMLSAQPQPEKQVAGLWHLTRAAALKEDGTLTEAQRRQLNPLIDRLYSTYHGSEEGLEGLRLGVLVSALPPPDFAIEPAALMAAKRAEEELAFRNPQLAAWQNIKKRLELPDGETYFAASLQGAVLPKLKGTVLRGTPAKKPAELVLALSDATTEEVTLKVSPPLPGEAVLGAQIDFEATGQSFIASPFWMVLVTTPDKIENWPAAARQ
jgi:hypothetical protein